jgi:hypothetical protein
MQKAVMHALDDLEQVGMLTAQRARLGLGEQLMTFGRAKYMRAIQGRQQHVGQAHIGAGHRGTAIVGHVPVGITTVSRCSRTYQPTRVHP